MNVVIRKALEAEAAVLSAIAMEAKAHWGYPREVLEAWRDELRISPADLASKSIYVATVEGAVVGFSSLRSAGGEWELDNVWVVPNMVARGIGRALVENALRIARAAGATRVKVDSDPHARGFYEACGAVVTGEVPAPIPGEPGRLRPQLVFVLHEDSHA